MERVLPRGDPDLAALYPLAQVWWLEISDTGVPVREIGFDASGTPIVLAPVGENVGFLVDSSDDWSDSQHDSGEVEATFEMTWNQLWPSFEHLETG